MTSDYSETLDDLYYAVFLFFVIVLICDISRGLLVQSGLIATDGYRSMALEIIGTMETAVICFEINFIIYDVYGVVVYTILLFITMIWQTLRAADYQYDASPLALLVKHVEGPVEPRARNPYASFTFVMLILWAQGMGAFLAYMFLMNFGWKYADHWTLFRGAPAYHIHRLKSVGQWQASISGSATVAGLVEGFFSFAQYLWPIFLRFEGLEGNTAAVVTDAGRAVFSGCGALYSGGYLNPIMASALELNTHGFSTLTKVGVYWVAPILGTILGIAVRRMV